VTVLRAPIQPGESGPYRRRHAPWRAITAFTQQTQERRMSTAIELTVNGKRVSAAADERTLLVQLIRERLQLTGTHVGCDTAQRGACTVHLNGRAVKACSMLAMQAQGAEVTTIEVLGKNGDLHPMQAAFRECHGLPNSPIGRSLTPLAATQWTRSARY
jgi:hypothetical protein